MEEVIARVLTGFRFAVVHQVVYDHKTGRKRDLMKTTLSPANYLITMLYSDAITAETNLSGKVIVRADMIVYPIL